MNNQKDKFLAMYGGDEHINSIIKNRSPESKTYLLQQNQSITPKHLDHFLKDKNEQVRAKAAFHDGMTHELLDSALKDDNAYVKCHALANKNITQNHIERHMNDMNFNVKSAIINSKATSNDQLMRIATDQDHSYSIRKQSTDKLKERLGMA